MTSKANLYLGTGILALLLFVDVGCKSKFAESAPETVQQQGLSLKERVQQKQQVDSRITEIEEALKKIKNIVELIRKANDTAFDTYYTAFDLLLDVNTELKTKFPENIEGKKVRYGTLIIPSDIVTSDCKNIATSLVSDDGLDSTGAFVGETLTYGFKSCGSDKYLDTVQAHWINQELEIKLISQNLETVFELILI